MFYEVAQQADFSEDVSQMRAPTEPGFQGLKWGSDSSAFANYAPNCIVLNDYHYNKQVFFLLTPPVLSRSTSPLEWAIHFSGGGRKLKNLILNFACPV